ncbi:hypothetical protein CASFOL_041141 [Castilleja foliolosa]|uniref:Uncharacterized protein n=1 Tax=Castilleja foliolosa TaxID=1961234 RepID=A0ABD3BDM7_9LAMI
MTSPSSSYTSSFFSRFCSSAIRSKPLSSSADAAVITSSGDGLVRRLGLFDLILMGIGASIGAGIFFVTGTVARDAGPDSHRHFCHHCWRLGAFKVDVSNWTPFAPNGFGSTRLLTLLKNQRGHKRERKSKVEDLGLTDEALFEELEYTSELVWNDPRHTYAWSHRQWALDRLGRGYADELGLCEHLGHQTHMRLIWDMLKNQRMFNSNYTMIGLGYTLTGRLEAPRSRSGPKSRCFAVRKCLAKGIAIIRSCEIRVAANAIKRNPEDENPWRYLRFLFKNDMNALAQSPHLRWVLKSVFVQSRDSVNSVIADQKLYKPYKYAWLFDSVNKRGCLFALDLLSDLLKYDEYKLDNEFIEAFKDVFQEYHGKTIAEKVDSVLREHRMELMELCEDFTRMITDITGGMDTTPPVDLEGVTAEATLSYEDNGSKIVGVMRSFFPCSELCDEAGFSSFSAIFIPDNPNWRPGVSKDESYKEWPTTEVTEDDHDDQYSVLTESLRNIWRQMDT